MPLPPSAPTSAGHGLVAEGADPRRACAAHVPSPQVAVRRSQAVIVPERLVTPLLLETKLRAPRQRRELVPRARLSDRLSRGSAAALTVVSAPAGFGKTTALTEWSATESAEGRAVAWVSLDARDDDPVVFWSYVVAALQTAVPSVGAHALSLLQSDDAPVEAFLATLLNELDTMSRDVVLVLDDYHVIESAELHDGVAFLIEHLPPQVHLVLAARADPPLPLARLRARCEVLEIRAADLRFTTAEVATYLHESMGLELAADAVDVLVTKTEGWIAALQLAALSMQGRDDVAEFVAGFAGDDRFIVDYLAEEVLERQSGAVRRFLLETAVLSRLTGPLCDAVTGVAGGTAMLRTLDRANLFLLPLDDRRLWYRYHHLFADVLRARLRDEDPERVRELHRRASDWFDASGDALEAIEHAMAGGHVERAAQLIELAAPALRRSRQEVTLRRWLDALPEDLVQARPVLSVATVGARMATGDTTGVEVLLQSAERWLGAPAGGPDQPAGAAGPIVYDEAELARLAAQVAIYRAALALLAGDIAGTVAHAERVLDEVEPSDHLRRGSAAALLGLAQWTVGDLEPARSRYADAVRDFVEVGHLSDAFGCSLALADIHRAQGHLGAAMATFESGLRHARAHPEVRGTADMHVGVSEVLLDRNELDGAARRLRAGAELGEQAGLPQHAHRWRVATARLYQARGDLDGAVALLDDAEHVYRGDFSPAVRPIPALRARVRLAQGDVDAAVRWASARGLTADDDLSYVQELEHITLARILLAQRTADRPPDAAIALLRRLLGAAEGGHREGSAIEILVLLSLAHDACGDRPAASAAVGEALALAEPEGYVRVFLDEGPAMTALLRSVSSHGGAGEQARHVLASATRGGTTTSARGGPVDALSDRELDVLRLLRSDLGGPAIARELLVSLNTMRTHTKSIYRKLGVNTRRGAVRRAGELGL